MFDSSSLARIATGALGALVFASLSIGAAIGPGTVNQTGAAVQVAAVQQDAVRG